MIEGEETNLPSPILIGDLLPQNTGKFYRYQGKLGVYVEPNCNTNIVGYHAITTVGYVTDTSTNAG